MKRLIVTNNILVKEKFNKSEEILFFPDKTLLDVLELTRNKVHEGHEILTHPLTGSIKPNETPFKSIVISEKKSKMDFDSLKLIEGAIETANKFLNDAKVRTWPERILDDFRVIDCNIITSGIESIRQFIK